MPDRILCEACGWTLPPWASFHHRTRGRCPECQPSVVRLLRHSRQEDEPTPTDHGHNQFTVTCGLCQWQSEPVAAPDGEELRQVMRLLDIDIYLHRQEAHHA